VEEGHMVDSPDVHAVRSRVRRGSGRIRDEFWRPLPAIEQQGATAQTKLHAAVTKVKSVGRIAAAARVRESAVAAALERAAAAAAAEKAGAAGAEAGDWPPPREAAGPSLFHIVLGRAASEMRHEQVKGLMSRIDGAIPSPGEEKGRGRGGGSPTCAEGAEAFISSFLDQPRDQPRGGAAPGRAAVGRGDSGDGITGLGKLARVAAMAHLYNAVCEQRGVPPVARILSQLGSAHLALRYYNLGPRGAAPLAIVLGSNAYWRSLDLSDNCLAPQASACAIRAC